MPSRYNLALAASLLVLFAVNTEAGNIEAAMLRRKGSNARPSNHGENHHEPHDGEVSVNMCRNPADLGTRVDEIDGAESDPDYCFNKNNEIERKLGSFETVTCAELCGPGGGAALRLMYASASCCRTGNGVPNPFEEEKSDKELLLCHNADGKCDAAETTTPSVTWVMPVLLILGFNLLMGGCGLCCRLYYNKSWKRRTHPTSVEG